jgi:uncharacterized protein
VIIREIIVPHFKEGDFEEGVNQGINAIIAEISGYKAFQEKNVTDLGFSIFLFPLFVIGAIISTVLFKKYQRNRTRYSKKTGQKMRKLSEAEEDEFLSKGMQAEERLGSVDYDVWVTADRGDFEIIAYKSKTNNIERCQKCDFLTMQIADRQTIKSAGMFSNGKGLEIRHCQNCGNETKSYYEIPRSGGGIYVGTGGFGGGFGGGGFGGFSGGGGSSGGGGASGDW